ncbi:MAG: helix-turn-helix transcriptional regulator [Colwellia sp.]|jgi:Helix-turn-helix.
MQTTTLEEFSAHIKETDTEVYAAAQEIKKGILLKLELKALREELGEKQSTVYKTMHIKQSAVSRIEKKGTNSKLATIKEYLASLGCTSALQVTLPDGSVKLLEV